MALHLASTLPLTGTSAHSNLRRLVILRYVVIAVEALLLGVAHRELGMGEVLVQASAAIGLLALANLFTQFRLRSPAAVTRVELFAQLAIDVAVLTGLLYFSGGSANPLVSLYLIPLIVTAALLPVAYTWLMAGLTVAAYSALMAFYVPLPGEHAGHGHIFGLHLVGMWMTFVLSAVLISVFVVRMAQSLRERDRQLADAREDALRNERIVALGTMAAGAAHELGTPLGTMSLVASELRDRFGDDTDARADLDELDTQIDNCKRIISGMLAEAGQARSESSGSQPADRFLADTLAKWQLMRPAAPHSVRWAGAGETPAIVSDQTLSQAIINLLNNAADASPCDVEIEGHHDAGRVVIEIRDRGPGLSADVLRHAGEAFFTTKGPGKGSGLGLFLANATIERFGGRVRLFNRPDGGACTEIVLPALTATEGHA